MDKCYINIEDEIPESLNEAMSLFVSTAQEHGIEIILEKGDHSLFIQDTNLLLGSSAKSEHIKLNWIDEYSTHIKRNYALSKEPLFRSLKLKGGDLETNSVVDASMGTGKDLCLLLSFGCRIMAFERKLEVFVLALWEYLSCCNDPKYGEVFKDRVSLNYGECQKSRSKDFKKCFFDPMYEAKQKSALSRKEMEIFKGLIGNDEDQASVLERLVSSFEITVLKRPIKAHEIKLSTPHISYSGKSTRYDRYFRN